MVQIDSMREEEPIMSWVVLIEGEPLWQELFIGDSYFRWEAELCSISSSALKIL